LVRILASATLVAGCQRAAVATDTVDATALASSGIASARAPAASAATSASAPVAAGDAATPVRAELPRGGRELLPRFRLVGFCGTPGASKLGKLAGNLAARAQAIETLGQGYVGDRAVLPVFELIAVVAQDAPGHGGKYRRRVADSVVDDYLAAARAAKALLLLNIQPGQSDFVTETRHFERWLREPDVGVALDPEWAMVGKQTPGAKFGRVEGTTIDEVAALLAEVVKANDLPEKALVFHQVNERIVHDEAAITPHPGVVLVKSVDGLGSRFTKIKTYNQLVKALPPGVHAGFKLFFDEDVAGGHRLMTPAEVLALTPVPDYVMYE